MIPSESLDYLWIVIVAFIFSFCLAFGVGANDVANSFGTSVGSKVLTLKQACLLGTIFEILGSTLIGYHVSHTVRKGIIDVSIYDGEEQLLMIGYLSSLLASSIWSLLATFYKLPVSGTHSIIGSIVGFHIIEKGLSYINYHTLLAIIASWIFSPILSGFVTISIYYLNHKYIIDHEKVLERGLMSLPFFYGSTVFVNLFSIMTSGPNGIGFGILSWYCALSVSFLISFIIALIVYFFIVPKQRSKILNDVLSKVDNNSLNLNAQTKIVKLSTKINSICKRDLEVGINSENNNKILNEDKKQKNDKKSNSKVDELKTNSIIFKNPSMDSIFNYNSSKKTWEKSNSSSTFRFDSLKDKTKSFSETVAIEDDKPEIAYLFKFLHILTACFASFAHGSNDVSNAIGPLIAVLLIWKEGVVFQISKSPPILMFYGGIGISLGLWILGRKVIQTIGNELIKIVPSTGFTIEIGTATTVLLASKIGLPISTTHCKVGSVIMVGRFQGSSESVNWKMFNNVVLAWILTVPVSAILAGIFMYFLKNLI